MRLANTLTENSAYVGVLAAMAVCIVLLVTYPVTALLGIPFDFVIPPDVLAAIVAILAAVGVAASHSKDGDADDGRVHPVGVT